MTEKQAYSYTVLRYIHDVVSGETLNVGIVMCAPATGFLQARTRKTVDRLKHVFPDMERRDFVDAMQAIDQGIADISDQAKQASSFDGDADARSHALKVLPDDDSALQWSPLGTGLTADPEKALERLYERYVIRYDARPDRRRTGEDIWRSVRNKLAERNVKIPFEPKVVAGAQDRIEFKKAWKNGRWHAYEPVSLDLADADEIKDEARKWRGHLGAVADGTLEEIDVHFLLGRPRDPSLLDAYENAKTILEHAPFTTEVVDENDEDDLVASIESDYRSRKG